MPGNIVNDIGSTCVPNGFHLWNSWSTIYSFMIVIVCTYDTFRPKFIKIITNGIIENSPGFKKSCTTGKSLYVVLVSTAELDTKNIYED